MKAVAYALIGHFHLNPDALYPHMLLDNATLLANANLQQAVLLAGTYAALRLTEGYGLWKDRVWAEWLAALSGSVYRPLEASHLMQHATAINCTVLGCNVVVVAYMTLRLWRRKAVNNTSH